MKAAKHADQMTTKTRLGIVCAYLLAGLLSAARAEVMSGPELERYRRDIRNTDEQTGESSAAEVMRKLLARPLPDMNRPRPPVTQFGLHGMELPFVQSGQDEQKMDRAYELLARAGVQSLRTAEGVWHRLGTNYDHYTELDYQLKMASRYGMKLMLTVGYPPEQFGIAPSYHSTFKPEFEAKFRDYLHKTLERAKGQVQIAELANEVDAPHVWWLGASADLYVRDMRILWEESRKVDPTIRLAAFAATYSRNDELGGENGGRRFVNRCFELGIDRYADLYTLHYTWPMAERDFPAYFHRVMAHHGGEKPLINSEETGYGRPSDVVKVFCRDLLLYGMESVYYFLARDFYENNQLMYTGLFDAQWNPKLRLLAYASAVDAIRDRSLVGMAQPASGVEAYVLKARDNPEDYAIVLWKNDPGVPENILQAPIPPRAPSLKVNGLQSVKQVKNWRLDLLSTDPNGSTVSVDDQPLVIFTSAAPKWDLMSPAEWLQRH